MGVAKMGVAEVGMAKPNNQKSAKFGHVAYSTLG